MCGIAGFWGRKHPSEFCKIIEHMLDSISHRGPDGRGTVNFDRACLGHVRLAIIDIAGGHQPLSTPDKRFWITYNGELYNFKDIRQELQDQGITFTTNCDTEVVIRAFQQKGISCLSRFRGMFAFAIWDDQKKEGYLVRDRFGIKPLFYTVMDGQLIFASEIKAILQFPGIRKKLDLDSLHLLMNYRYIPGTNTLFTDVHHLEPGFFLHWTTEGILQKKWSPDSDPQEIELSLTEIRAALKNAVNRQLISDVPLGGYLSAGIDSATLLALSIKEASPQSSPSFPTFTIQTGDSPLEHVQAAATARYFGVSNTQSKVESDLQSLLPRMIWHLEVPKVNALQSALVARLAAQNVKVALSGLGGDEIFLGYNIHRFLARLNTLHKKIPPLPRLAGWTLQALFSGRGPYFEEYARGGQVLQYLPDYGRAYGIIRNVWDSPHNRQRIYGPRMLDHQPRNAFGYLQDNWDSNTPDPVTACAGFEMQNKLVNDLLLQEDRLSMAFGLEVRVPFLDEDLVSLVGSIASQKRMPGRQLKGLMKKVVNPWLPEEILNRPKSGFQIPIHEIFTTHLKPMAENYLSRDRLKSDGLFNHNFVINVLKAKPDYRLRWHYFMLYLMIGTNIWIDLFEKNEPVPAWS
jgi:asparagine synthase (glutamine-hydrolysing)